MPRGVPCRDCSTPIDETSRYGRTPARSAASASRTAAAWSTVCLRSAPLPGPAPAAKTTASAPPTTPATSSTEADSRSSTAGSTPSSSRSPPCSALRTMPTTVSPRAESRRPSRRATCPWAPAMTMRMGSSYPAACLPTPARPVADAARSPRGAWLLETRQDRRRGAADGNLALGGQCASPCQVGRGVAVQPWRRGPGQLLRPEPPEGQGSEHPAQGRRSPRRGIRGLTERRRPPGAQEVLIAAGVVHHDNAVADEALPQLVHETRRQERQVAGEENDHPGSDVGEAGVDGGHRAAAWRLFPDEEDVGRDRLRRTHDDPPFGVGDCIEHRREDRAGADEQLRFGLAAQPGGFPPGQHHGRVRGKWFHGVTVERHAWVPSTAWDESPAGHRCCGSAGRSTASGPTPWPPRSRWRSGWPAGRWRSRCGPRATTSTSCTGSSRPRG